MRRQVEVKIAGKTFVFNLPKDIKPDEFAEIAGYVENKMNKIKAELMDLDSFKLGLLTSLNIAEELFSLKKENQSLRNMLNKIDTIVSPVDEEVSPEDSKKVSIRFSS
ncbi:MAG: cell division protein ZapA [Candidatus Aminicenantes bacterium]|nr:cell division protein ZapA [Candidatus Aminicenantes bacterium]